MQLAQSSGLRPPTTPAGSALIGPAQKFPHEPEMELARFYGASHRGLTP